MKEFKSLMGPFMISIIMCLLVLSTLYYFDNLCTNKKRKIKQKIVPFYNKIDSKDPNDYEYYVDHCFGGKNYKGYIVCVGYIGSQGIAQGFNIVEPAVIDSIHYQIGHSYSQDSNMFKRNRACKGNIAIGYGAMRRTTTWTTCTPLGMPQDYHDSISKIINPKTIKNE